jgi:DNA repair protein RadC
MSKPSSRLRPQAGLTRRFVASVVREDAIPTTPLDSPDEVLGFYRKVIATQPDHEPDKEALSVILVTARLRPFAWHRVSVGTLDETTAHPREILRPVLIGASYGFAMVHNHPSGDPAPSPADIELTRRIQQAADLLRLNLVDHVIVTEAGRRNGGIGEPFFSFKEAALI